MKGLVKMCGFYLVSTGKLLRRQDGFGLLEGSPWQHYIERGLEAGGMGLMVLLSLSPSHIPTSLVKGALCWLS